MEIKELKKSLAGMGIAGLIAGVGLFNPACVNAGSG
ncbi:MAG: SbtA family thio(seleno)oxazole RiPP natural product precursor [Thermodesulfobacteriota bacterium]